MNETPLYISDIMKRIPHRYPFLMIDRVLRYGGREVIAVKNVTINEPYFSGHFPAEPIMPGVLIGEAMAQACAFLGDDDEATHGKLDGGIGEKAFLTSINLKIEHVVRPGDQMLITARLVKRLGKLMRVSATASVDKIPVASAEITVALVC